MRRVVVDASVAVKWVFPGDPQESHVAEALQILHDIRAGRCDVVQPPHWLAEVAAVAARFDSSVAEQAVDLLFALDFPVLGGPEVYRVAIDLAATLDHHLFDTLYHAVAICDDDAELFTADRRYHQKARGQGRIRLLENYGT